MSSPRYPSMDYEWYVEVAMSLVEVLLLLVMGKAVFVCVTNELVQLMQRSPRVVQHMNRHEMLDEYTNDEFFLADHYSVNLMLYQPTRMGGSPSRDVGQINYVYSKRRIYGRIAYIQ